MNSAKLAFPLIDDPDIPGEHVVRTFLVTLATTIMLREQRIDLEVLELFNNLSAVQLSVALREGNGKKFPESVETKAIDFDDQFSNISLGRPPIDFSFIYKMEKQGTIAVDTVREWILERFSFGDKNKEPAWRKIWDMSRRPKNEVELAIDELAEELQKQQIDDSGIILHVIGLALKLRQFNDTRLTNGEEIIDFFTTYIEALNDGARAFPLHPGNYLMEALAPNGSGYVGELIFRDSNGKVACRQPGEVKVMGDFVVSSGEPAHLDTSFNYVPDLSVCVDVSWQNTFPGGFSEYSVTACLSLI